MSWFQRRGLEPLRRVVVVCAVCAIGCGIHASISEAAVVKGLQEVVAGVFQVPLSIISGTFSGPPIIGTLFGAASGLLSGHS